MDELILDLIDYGVDDEYDTDEESGEITIYVSVKFRNTLKRMALRLPVLSLHAYLTT